MMRKIILGLLAVLALGTVAGDAQQTLPPNTVVGRLGIGPGPSQAIPFATLAGALGVVGVTGPPTTVAGQVATWANTTGTVLNSTPAAQARGSGFLNIDSATAFGDTNGTIAATDRTVYHTALSAARTDSLPLANTVNAGQTIYILDVRGVATASNTITLTRAGADTINGGTTFAAIAAAFGSSECWSDGVSRWACQAFASGGGGGVTSATIAAGTGISVAGTCAITSTGTCTITSNTTPLNNTWTGSNIFTGKAVFGNGKPWADVTSGANSCAAAVGNGSNNDTAAIQCQVTFMNATYGGGIVFFPPGSYKVTSTVTVGPGVMLVGAGRKATNITSAGADITVLTFAGAGNDFMGMNAISILGNQTGGATAVMVTADGVTNISDSNLWGGLYALQMAGSDGMVLNSFIMGFGSTGGNVVSNGSNWYIRVKFDDAGQSHLYGFWQQWDGVSAVSENHFVICDFTGNFSSAAVKISGGANVHIMVFQGGVIAPAGGAFSIENDQARFVSLSGVELGANISVNAIPTSIVASYGFSGIAAIGATCAANVAITC